MDGEVYRFGEFNTLEDLEGDKRRVYKWFER